MKQQLDEGKQHEESKAISNRPKNTGKPNKQHQETKASDNGPKNKTQNGQTATIKQNKTNNKQTKPKQ